MTDENLKLLVAAARERGYYGVAIWNQGGPCGWCAGVTDGSGRLAPDPRPWDTRPTPTAALTDLGRLLGVALLGETAGKGVES